MKLSKFVGCMIAGSLVCGSVMAETDVEYPNYSYSSTDISIFPSIESSGQEGHLLAINSLLAMNENNHLVLGLDYGDYDNDLSKVRFGLGWGYNFLLEGGEATMSLGAKVLHQREEQGRADDDDTGYSLMLAIRHFYQGDITTFDLEGQIEGYWELERQDIMDVEEFTSRIGGRYHFNEGAAVQLELQVLDDNMTQMSSFPSVSVGMYFSY